jgi:hypothetical protein
MGMLRIVGTAMTAVIAAPCLLACLAVGTSGGEPQLVWHYGLTVGVRLSNAHRRRMQLV